MYSLNCAPNSRPIQFKEYSVRVRVALTAVIVATADSAGLYDVV